MRLGAARRELVALLGHVNVGKSVKEAAAGTLELCAAADCNKLPLLREGCLRSLLNLHFQESGMLREQVGPEVKLPTVSPPAPRGRAEHRSPPRVEGFVRTVGQF